MTQGGTFSLVTFLLGLFLAAAAAAEIYNLESKSLAQNASLPQNEHFGPDLRSALIDSKKAADTRAIEWRGLSLVVSEGLIDATGINAQSLENSYRRIMCQSDAVVIGRVNGARSHLSASGMGLYTDYSVVPEIVYFSKPSVTVRVGEPIAVTMPGGEIVLPEGRISFENRLFPRLRTDARYLQFLSLVSKSGAYQPIEEWGTLMEGNSTFWVPAGKSFRNIQLSMFDFAVVESTLKTWINACGG